MLDVPLPAVDAETLAAHLHQHAEVARQRSAAIQAALSAEEAAEARAREETEALRAELRQYHGWINKELEGGHAFRLSKALHDERERKSNCEREVAALREHFASLSAQLQVLVSQARGETAEQRQVRAADEALSSLERLRRISDNAAAKTAAASAGEAEG